MYIDYHWICFLDQTENGDSGSSGAFAVDELTES